MSSGWIAWVCRNLSGPLDLSRPLTSYISIGCQWAWSLSSLIWRASLIFLQNSDLYPLPTILRFGMNTRLCFVSFECISACDLGSLLLCSVILVNIRLFLRRTWLYIFSWHSWCGMLHYVDGSILFCLSHWISIRACKVWTLFEVGLFPLLLSGYFLKKEERHGLKLFN